MQNNNKYNKTKQKMLNKKETKLTLNNFYKLI